MGDRAHERPVRVADVAVDHLEVALVDRQVDRLAQRPAAVVERPARVGELHEVAEVLDRGVAPPLVEVVDERRAVGRHEDHVRVADLHAPGGVAGQLREQARRRGLDQRAAHPAREPDPRAVHVGAGVPEDPDRIREVDDLDPDLLEERVRVRFDLFETAGRDDLDRGKVAGEVGQRVHGPRQAFGLAGCPAASHRRVLEVLCRHLITSGWVGPRGRSRTRHGTAPRFRGEAPARDPRRRRGSPGAARRSRRSRGRPCPRRAGPRRGRRPRPASRR